MPTDTYTAKMSPIPLQPGMQIVFEAINTSTGAAVSGVTVSNVAIFPDDLGAGGVGLEAYGPFMFVPGGGA